MAPDDVAETADEEEDAPKRSLWQKLFLIELNHRDGGIASIWDRVRARLIDFVLFTGLVSVITPAAQALGLIEDYDGTAGFADTLRQSHGQAFVMVAVLWLAYEAIPVAIWGQTAGKRWMRLAVSRNGENRPPSWVASAARAIAIAAVEILAVTIDIQLDPDASREVAGATIIVGAYVAFLALGRWDPTNRMPHDLTAGTQVVYRAS